MVEKGIEVMYNKNVEMSNKSCSRIVYKKLFAKKPLFWKSSVITAWKVIRITVKSISEGEKL